MAKADAATTLETEPARFPDARFIGSEIYRHSSYGGWHPLRIPRVSTTMDLSRALGWLGPGNYITSPRAKAAALSHWHDPAYLAALQRAEETGAVDAATRARHNIGTHANPIFPEVWRRPATSAGAALMAAEMLAAPGRIFAPACGTHHGLPDRANGFCYLNDPVLAILALRRQGLRRVAYVDLDAHHCDGVAHAFAADADVLLISTHEENRWPRTGALTDAGAGAGLGAMFNLPLPAGVNDDAFALITDRLILPAVTAFRPDALVIQCGSDALADDPQSRLMLSNRALWATLAALMPLSDRVLVTGGGGYNPWSVGRAWTGLWGVVAGFDVPDVLPAPAEAVLRALSWPQSRLGRNPPAHWFTTLADAPHHGPIPDAVRARLDVLTARLAVWV